MGKIDQSNATQTEIDDDIPIIDFSAVANLDNLSNTEDLAALIAEVGRACEKWGVFQVINHGISQETLDKPDIAGRKYFALPKEEKRKSIRDKTNPSGYFDSEITENDLDWKEVYEVYVKQPAMVKVWPDEPAKPVHSRWPDNPADFKDLILDYAREAEKLTFKVMELIAMSLGLAPDRFNGFFKDHTSVCRLNHYSPCPCPDQYFGVGPHKDSGGLTMIGEDDVGGMQVQRRSDGVYVDVKPTRGALVVFVSDLIQVWTNDKYESALHRVMVNSERHRYSNIFGFYPSHYINVKPLEEFVSEENPPKYKEYHWGDFHASRKKTNFKKFEEHKKLQITHFKETVEA